jgi:hypothetical protein
VLVLIVAGIAFTGTRGGIPSTRAFTPKSNGYALVTKGTYPVSVNGVSAIRSLCTADCTYTFNGTGPSWLLKANTPDIPIYVPVGVKTIVFSVTSSAGTGIYTQAQTP